VGPQFDPSVHEAFERIDAEEWARAAEPPKE
jgi:molecular chaperone GrpE (heat shock protein)